MKHFNIHLDEHEYAVSVEELSDNKLKIKLDDEEHIIKINEVTRHRKIKNIKRIEESKDSVIKAPMTGVVTDVLAKKGDSVNSNDLILKFVAMKMENKVLSPKSAKIKEVKVKKGDLIQQEQVLVVFE